MWLLITSLIALSFLGVFCCSVFALMYENYRKTKLSSRYNPYINFDNSEKIWRV